MSPSVLGVQSPSQPGSWGGRESTTNDLLAPISSSPHLSTRPKAYSDLGTFTTEKEGLMAMRQRKTRGWTTVSSSQQKPPILFVFLMRTRVLPPWVHRPDPTQAGKGYCVVSEEKHLPALVGVGVSQDSGGHLPYLPHLQVEKPETERGKPIPSLS